MPVINEWASVESSVILLSMEVERYILQVLRNDMTYVFTFEFIALLIDN